MSEKSTSHKSLGSALKTSWQQSGLGQSPRFLAVSSCTVQTLHAFPLGTKLESSGRYRGISRNVQQGHSWLPTRECEPQCGKPFSWLVPHLCTNQGQRCVPAPRKDNPVPPSVRVCLHRWYVVTDLAQSDAKPLGAENLVPAVRHRIRLDALGFIKTFSQELILGSCRDLCWSWMNVSSASQQITHNRKPMKPQAGC